MKIMPRGFFDHAVFFVGSTTVVLAAVSLGCRRQSLAHASGLVRQRKPRISGQFDPVLPEHANRGTVGNSEGCFRSTFFVRSSKGQLS